MDAGVRHLVHLLSTLVNGSGDGEMGNETGDGGAYQETEDRYRAAVKIAGRWIKNYTELDFRSLGSYTRAELNAIAAAGDGI